MTDQGYPTITAVQTKAGAVVTIKAKRRKPNHALITEAESDALEFANKADYWMRVAAAETFVIIMGACYIAFRLI